MPDPTPIDAVLVSAADVSKPDFKTMFNARLRQQFADAAEVRSRDLTPLWLLNLRSTIANYSRDPTDTTSPDDGVQVIIDAAGNRWKLQESAVDSVNGQTGNVDLVTPRVVTASGDINMIASDNVICVNKTAGAATNINLLTAVGRIRPLTVKDLKGDAATNPITLVPVGGQTIDGAANYIIDFNSGAVTVRPLPSGAGWFIA